jgi:hypothetical protein
VGQYALKQFEEFPMKERLAFLGLTAAALIAGG